MKKRNETGLSARTGIALYKRAPKDVSEFIVHYDGGKTPTTEAEELSLLKAYDRYHAGKGWGGIGYNLAVGPVTGNVYEARGLDRVGAHTVGHNTSGVGVVVIGGNDALTPKAKEGLQKAYKIANKWSGKNLKVYGHRDFASTSCPGDNIYGWISEKNLSDKSKPTGGNVSKKYIIKQGSKVAPGTYAAYEKLRAAFKKATGYDLLITSGYRTYEEQKSLYDRWKAGTFHAPSVARPGTSLHESGRALDLRDSGSDAGVTIAGNVRSNWMRNNSAKYGFAANGYSFREPWHFEFTGNPWTGTGASTGGGSASTGGGSNTQTSAHIKLVQTLLIDCGYHMGKWGADGVNGATTKKQVKAFQKKYGLKQDSIAGSATLKKLRQVALQRAVKANPDGIIGADSKKRVNAVRSASRYGGFKFPYGVKYAQQVVGVRADNIWGSNSGKAHDATVVKIQRAVGATQDGIWGKDTNAKVRKIGA